MHTKMAAEIFPKDCPTTDDVVERSQHPQDLKSVLSTMQMHTHYSCCSNYIMQDSPTSAENVEQPQHLKKAHISGFNYDIASLLLEPLRGLLHVCRVRRKFAPLEESALIAHSDAASPTRHWTSNCCRHSAKMPNKECHASRDCACPC